MPKAFKPPSLLAQVYSLFANRYSLLGFLFFLAIVLPWHIVAALRNPGFFQFYIVDNQFLRFLNSRAFTEGDVPISTVAFLVLTVLWFFPWSLFIPAALSRGIFERHLEQPHVKNLRLLVWVWALAVIGFFSLSDSKLEHYFLPAIPPLSLIIGGLWTQGFASPRFVPSLERWLGVGALGCSLFGVGLLLFSDLLTPQALLAGLAELNVYYRVLQEQGATLPFASVSPFVQLLKGLGIALVVGFPLSFVFFHLRLPKASFISILLLGGAVALLVFRLDLVVESHHSSQAVARALMARSGPNDLIVYEGSLEYPMFVPPRERS
jgi:4-amino-4-deoxy-L-arabinose transferase-like glycosyltransferase